MGDIMTKNLLRVDHVFAAELGDATLLLNADAGYYHGLNPVGARIWELLAKPTDEDGLVAQLTEEFDVTPETCRTEVARFLADLRERGLLAQ